MKWTSAFCVVVISFFFFLQRDTLCAFPSRQRLGTSGASPVLQLDTIAGISHGKQHLYILYITLWTPGDLPGYSNYTPNFSFPFSAAVEQVLHHSRMTADEILYLSFFVFFFVTE